MLLNMIGLPTSPRRGTPLYNGQLTQFRAIQELSTVPAIEWVLRTWQLRWYSSCSWLFPRAASQEPWKLYSSSYHSITDYRYPSSLKQRTYYLEVPLVKSLDMAELSPLLRVWQGCSGGVDGLPSHQRPDWRRSGSQAPTGCWQNSFPSACLTSFYWMLAGGCPQILATWVSLTWLLMASSL